MTREPDPAPEPERAREPSDYHFTSGANRYRCRQVTLEGMLSKVWMVSVNGSAGVPFSVARADDLADPSTFERRVVATFEPK